MKIGMTRLITATLLAICSALAWATELKIGAGSTVGEYTNTIVPALDKQLRAYGYSAKAQISEGSQQNVDDVLSGKLLVALSQWDVAALNMEESAHQDKLALIGKMAPEALLCAVNKTGRARTLHDFTDSRETPLKVSVGGVRSGSAKTFAYLQRLDPRLKGVTLIHESNIRAELYRLASNNRDAVCFVMMPNPDNPLLRLVADHDDLEFIDFVNDKFANAQIGGKNVYDVIEVPVSPGVWGIGADTVRTLVTWVGMVVNKEKADLALIVTLNAVASEPELLPPTTAVGKAILLFDKYKVKASELTETAVDMASEYGKKAGEKAQELKEKAQEMMNQ